MGMAFLQFYKNKYRYPQYVEGLTRYGQPMECTPVGFNLRTGTLRVAGNMTDFMSCNYLAFERDNQTIYAWIEDVRFRTEDSFEVSYSVDAWRTYKSKVSLGAQYISRSPVVTNLRDDLLGSTKPYAKIESKMYHPAYSYRRIFVVQTRTLGDDPFANTPVQPTPYQFYLTPYDVSDWQTSAPLVELMTKITGGAEPQNIVTMYSIPYIDLTGIGTNPLPVQVGGEVSYTTNNFHRLEAGTNASEKLFLETPLLFDNVSDLLKVDHSVQIVIPEAGIINIPDELLVTQNLKLRQDIDLFSGASNYMLVAGEGAGQTAYYDLSVRGSSISSIPIVSDPLDTYLSQNQNALATSLIGDVATIAIGAGLMRFGGGAGLGTMMGGAAGGSMAVGANGLLNTASNIGDIKNGSYSNPPAFLGTALAGNFNQQFWVVTRKAFVENEAAVHANFGYPYNMVADLSFPSGGGFVQTKGCNVASDGSVPKWALDEINNMFDSGVLVNLA